jgi:hypothetical protein
MVMHQHVPAAEIRTKAHHTTSTLAVDGPKNHPEKRKEKHRVLEFFSSNKSCRYTKPVQIFYIYLRFYLLHPSKAHRIFSVKMAGYFWGKKILNIYSYSNCLFVLAFCWSRAGMLWRDGRLGYLKHFVQRRDRSQWSLSLG